MNDHHVLVKFGQGIPSDLQGVVMLRLEQWLRDRGVPAEVYKATMADDSKLREAMTPEMRKNL